MRTAKRILAVLVLISLALGLNPSFASADVFTPDNSNKPDPLQAAKQMGGNLEVGEFTGAAIYRYPLTLPPGRNGLTPSVELSYNSQDSALDSIAGYRWSLNQYSIKRINKRGVEKIYDQTDFVASGPFGGGELAPISLNNGQFGQYGEKTERSFSNYQFQDSNQWTITDKRGNHYLFGATEEGRQSDPDDPTRTVQWMLQEIRDPNDNWIRHTYLKDGNQVYPKTIRYGGHGDEDGVFEVRFLPFADGTTGSNRVENHTSFAQGFRVDTNGILTGVEIKVEGQTRRKYDIGLTNVPPLVRKTIGSITETGISADGTTTTLPATSFEYTPSTVGWQETTDYVLPAFLTACNNECNSNAASWDMNGDGLVDFEASDRWTGYHRYTNNGNNGFNESSPQFVTSGTARYPSVWDKVADFNGDNRIDIISSGYHSSDGLLHSTLRLDGRETLTNTIGVGFGLPSYGQDDNGASLADLNGDGLPDIIQSHSYYFSGAWSSSTTIDKNTCLNQDGTSCVKTNLWEAPIVFVGASGWTQSPRQHFVQDCNYDGLADIIFMGSGGGIWMNDGKGGWLQNSGARCDFSGMDSLTNRSFDANGDGLIDQVNSYLTITDGGQFTTNTLSINTGNGFQTIQNVFPLTLGSFASGRQDDGGVRIEDINGDGLPDVIQSAYSSFCGTWTCSESSVKKTFLNTGSTPYYLKTVRTGSGATLGLSYKNSAQFRKADDTQANPKLPISVKVLTQTTTDDGLGHVATTDYFYEDGHYHFQNSTNKEFAGFRVVTKTDELGNKTKTYYHQSESSVADPAHGEWDDHLSKKGLAYRTELYDNQGRLVQTEINRIEKKDLGGRTSPYVEKSVSVTTDPASGDKKATAKASEYDNFGNPTTVTDYGEVSLSSDDGSFTDIGNDLIKQTISYAQPVSADQPIGTAYQTQTTAQDGSKLSEQRTTFDGLALGSVDKGNPTLSETWLDTTDGTVTNSVEYDVYGLPTKMTNARGFSTTMEYDAAHLYPLSVTNALGQTSHQTVDLATGQPLESIDPNGLTSQTRFDGAGRAIQSSVSDPKNPGQLVVTSRVTFIDTGMPRSVRTTAVNDDGTEVDSIAFLDGLGRTIETKAEAGQGRWSTSQTIADTRGLVRKSILPYYSNSDHFDPLDDGKPGTVYEYDALRRPTKATTPIGSTLFAYRGWWAQTITDPGGKAKDFMFDARGRMTEVVEHNKTNLLHTLYAYDPAGRLTKITDALGNLRTFEYDSLGRRTAQTDPHKPSANGQRWTYAYDENSNLTERTNPNGQKARNTYDPLDRATQTDLDSGAGVDFAFEYDVGPNAIGRLDKVTGQNFQKSFDYDLLGRITRERRTIGGRPFEMSTDYDLLGGVKTLTYPDGMTTDYQYDDAHRLASVKSGDKTLADNLDYSPLGQPAHLLLGNGVTTDNQFDPNQQYRLVRKTSLLQDTVRLQDSAYQFDAVGNLMKLTDESASVASKTVDYLYDDLDRVLEARYTNTGNSQFFVQNFQYNAIGNLTYKSGLGAYEYKNDNPHAATKAGAKAFAYDPAGNMTQRDGKTYQYDEFGKILKIADKTTYAYDEAGQRISKTDLKTGQTKIYWGDLYESEGNQETKTVFAGPLRIAKVTRKTVEPPTVDPVEQPITDPAVTFGGTKPADLALWLNGVEILAAGPETTWTYPTTLIPGDNLFDFYTRQDAETVSRKVTMSLHYEVPTPTLEPVDSPQTATRVTLKGTKGTNTSLWINGTEMVPINTETTWQSTVDLPATENRFEITAKDRLGNPSSTVTTDIAYTALPPTVDPFDQPAKANPLTLSGTKAPGMGLWINGEEAVAANEDTTWTTRLTLAKGINSFELTARNAYGIESAAVLLTIPYEINAPSVDPVLSPTHETAVKFTGSKRAYTALWINGKEVVELDAEEVWETTVQLKALENHFEILTKDEEGLESEAIQLDIAYDPAQPTTDPTPETTGSNPFSLSGTKVVGTAIWINGKEVVPADELTVWLASLPLDVGQNTLEIKAVNRYGIESESTTVTVNCTQSYRYAPVDDRSPGGGGGGGYSSDPLTLKRLAERKAQADELAALAKAEKEDGATEANTATEDLVFRNQSGNRSNTPKPLWPTAQSKTNVEFRNVRIAYGDGKATLTWDAMSKEVAMFEVYRSTDPVPSTSAKNTALKAASLKANADSNRFVDKVKKGDQHTYRIAALNKAGKILRTSLMLTPDTLYVTEKTGGRIDFSQRTDKTFNKVYIADHPRFDFKATDDPKTMLVQPTNGFKHGARITVRFINCQPKKDGKPYCESVDQKTFDVFVTKANGLSSRLRQWGDKLISLAIPAAQAKGPDPEEKIEYYLTDHLGGVEAVMDEQGNVVERRDYLPFGEERIDEGTDDEPHGFTGKELDAESGLYYYGARYYDPILGRFASLDPLILGESQKPLESVLSNPQELNSYSYVTNNPLRYVDKEGKYGEDVHYDLTIFLASASGLSQHQSKTIARFDQFVDDNPETLPSNFESPDGTNQTVYNVTMGITNFFHFTNREEAMNRLGKAITNESLSQFGAALHSFQDSYSHQFLNPFTHALLGKTPDKTSLNVTKAFSMSKASFYFLRVMNAQINKDKIGDIDLYNQESDDIWSKISPIVLDQLQKENKSDTQITKYGRTQKNGDKITSK